VDIVSSDVLDHVASREPLAVVMTSVSVSFVALM